MIGLSARMLADEGSNLPDIVVAPNDSGDEVQYVLTKDQSRVGPVFTEHTSLGSRLYIGNGETLDGCAAELDGLLESGASRDGAAHLKRFFDQVLRQAITIGGYDNGSIMLRRGDGTLEIAAHIGLDPALASRQVRETEGVAGHVLSAGRPLFLRGLAEKLEIPARTYAKDCSFSACLPLVTPRGDALGVLCLNRVDASKGPAGDDHRPMLEAMASQVALLIDNVRLRSHLEHSIEELVTLYCTGQLISSSLDHGQVLRSIVDLTCKILRAEYVRMYDIAQTGELKLVAHHGRTIRVSKVPGLLANQAILSGKVVEFDEGRPQRGRRGADATCGWLAPLRIRGRTVGLLEVGLRAGSSTAPGNSGLLAGMANQAALALENARLFRTVREREARLSQLVERLITAQEEERRMAAFDIHDGLVQILAAAHQHLQTHAELAPDSSRARDELRRGLELLKEAIGESRRLIGNFRPVVLDTFGLGSAIRSVVEQTQLRTGLHVEFIDRLGGQRFPTTVEIAVFRVAQEALTNVEKHSRADRLRVLLDRSNSSLILEVRDWGCGFAEEVTATAPPADGRRNLGLASMRERAKLLGGTCEIRSHSKGGTTVHLSIPLRLESSHANADR